MSYLTHNDIYFHTQINRRVSLNPRFLDMDFVKYIEKKLNIKVGETTKDGMFSLKVAECLGSCGTSPMLQCGASYHENLTYEKVDALLENYKSENYKSVKYSCFNVMLIKALQEQQQIITNLSLRLERLKAKNKQQQEQ